MNLVIFGDRKFTEFDYDPITHEKYNTGNYMILKALVESCESVLLGKVTHVITGKAKGADTLGEKWGRSRGLEILEFPADWETYGKGAGPIRNRQMAEISDLGIGFLAPKSIGTKDMIKTLRKLEVPVLVYYIDSGKIDIFTK